MKKKFKKARLLDRSKIEYKCTNLYCKLASAAEEMERTKDAYEATREKSRSLPVAMLELVF